MPLNNFKSYINKAINFGYNSFNLTPVIGECMTDPSLMTKLEYLEGHKGVLDYYFCTNFSLATLSLIKDISKLSKLRSFAVSIYGHDLTSFLNITNGSEADYKAIKKNLYHLLNTNELIPKSEIRIRSVKFFDLDEHDSDICKIIKLLKARGLRIRVPERFQNWGGLIKQAAIEKQNLKYKQAIPKKSPCVFIFYKPTILPDGRINVCAEGDASGNHVIGNLEDENFREVYSINNERYLKFLNLQMSAAFCNHCKACTAYRGIEQDWYTYLLHHKDFISLKQFGSWLENKIL